MGRSRRKYKKSRQKVRVGLPKKKPGVFRPAFTVPPQLLSAAAAAAAAGERGKVWNEEASVLQNYRTFGVVANPNLHGVCARTPQIIQCASLQVPASRGGGEPISEFDPIDSGSDLEHDDLKAALGKKRRDGKAAPLQPLTTIQRVHIGRLIDKYGDDCQACVLVCCCCVAGNVHGHPVERDAALGGGAEEALPEVPHPQCQARPRPQVAAAARGVGGWYRGGAFS